MDVTKLPWLSVTLVTMFAAGSAMAVGDPPTTLDRRHAASAYADVRRLLTMNGVPCPRGQAPVSGLVTAGGAPGLGSHTTTVTFDQGAVVTIVRAWATDDAGAVSSTVRVDCQWRDQHRRSSSSLDK